MSIVSLPQTVRGIQRLQHIAQVLTRHGFGHVVDRLNLRRYVPLAGLFGRATPADPDADPLVTVGNRLVRVCEELGPTFVKLGQMVSARPDLLPQAVVGALTRLQDRVEPFPTDQARTIIAADLGGPIEQLYSAFEPHPIASGSMAQVHAGCTRDGRDVVIKVKRPGIDAVVRLDMHVLAWLADLAESYLPELRVYRPKLIVDEFSQSINRELDFIYEASATHRFAEAFRDDPTIHIPRVEWELTGTNVLTMQRMTGTPFRTALAGQSEWCDRRALARSLFECFLKQYFEIGLFHADPHPGNLLVYPPDQLGLIDFGMVGQVQDEVTGQLVLTLVASLQREVDVVIEVLADLAAIGPATDRAALRRELRELLEKYYGLPLKRLQLDKLFYEFTDLFRRHSVALPRDFVMLGKSLITIAGVTLQLDPDLNLLELLRPRIRRLLAERLSPQRLVRGLVMGAWHLGTVVREAPRLLRDVMRRAGAGHFQVNIRHQNLDYLASEIDRSSNRLSFSVFLAATIIGSSMLVQVPYEDVLFGVLPLRYLGALGFAAAFLMGLGLIYAILRSGKLS